MHKINRTWVINYVKADATKARINLRRLNILTRDDVLLIGDDSYRDDPLTMLCNQYDKCLGIVYNPVRLKLFGYGFSWTRNYLQRVIDHNPEVDIITKIDPDTEINSYPFLPTGVDITQPAIYSPVIVSEFERIPLIHGAYLNITRPAAELILESDIHLNLDRGRYISKNRGTSQDRMLTDIAKELSIPVIPLKHTLCSNVEECRYTYPLSHFNDSPYTLGKG